MLARDNGIAFVKQNILFIEPHGRLEQLCVELGHKYITTDMIYDDSMYSKYRRRHCISYLKSKC